MVRRKAKPFSLSPVVGDFVGVPTRRDITLPERVLQDFGRDWQGLWRLAEAVRARPQMMNLQAWQPWCFLPINVASGLMIHLSEGMYDSTLQAETMLHRESRMAAALAAWRMTKGVYSFDPTVLRALFESDLKDGLPEECFLRLPEWCVYIPTPGIEYMPGLPMHGFFAFVDDHGVGGRDFTPELNFQILIDPSRGDPEMVKLLARVKGEDALEGEYIYLHGCVDLKGGSFEASLKGMLDTLLDRTLPTVAEAVEGPLQEGLRSLSQAPDNVREKFLADTLIRNLRLANVLLYLCADEADIAPHGLGNRRQAVLASEGGSKRTFMASTIMDWKVGWRIGADLRLAARNQEQGEGTRDGNGSSPRPHIRRAHWHTFLVGARSGVQERRVKWLPPIAVNVQSADQLVPAMRRVMDTVLPPPSCGNDHETTSV